MFYSSTSKIDNLFLEEEKTVWVNSAAGYLLVQTKIAFIFKKQNRNKAVLYVVFQENPGWETKIKNGLNHLNFLHKSASLVEISLNSKNQFYWTEFKWGIDISIRDRGEYLSEFPNIPLRKSSLFWKIRFMKHARDVAI